MKKNKITIILLSIFVIASVVMIIQYMNPVKEVNSRDNLSSAQSNAEPNVDINSPNTSESVNDTDEITSTNTDRIANTDTAKDIFDGSGPIIKNMNETLSIVALPKRKQGEKPPTSDEIFATWEGEMSVKVTKATLYNSIEETNIPKEDFSDSVEQYEVSETCKTLLIELQLTNISAKDNVDAEKGDNYFTLSMFEMSSEFEFSMENFTKADPEAPWIGMYTHMLYSSVHLPGDEYYFFRLDQGETKTITIGTIVDEATQPIEDLILEIKTDSYWRHIFGIRLEDIERA